MKALYFICCLFICNLSFAQTKVYNASKEIKGSDYTYLCAVEKNVVVTLSNKNQTFVGVAQKYAATNKEAKESSEPFVEGDVIAYKKCMAICSEILDRYIDDSALLALSLYIHPISGEITDVVYVFTNFQSLGNVPPDTYRELELRLKKDVQFTPTNTGRTVNYIFRNLHYKKND